MESNALAYYETENVLDSEWYFTPYMKYWTRVEMFS